MNLINNSQWTTVAKKKFTFNEIFTINNEKCEVDYAHKTSSNELTGFGFDLLIDDIKEDKIFSYLLEDKSEKGEFSLLSKMFKFYDFGDNPIVFLVSKTKLYYMPNGIRQTNPYAWKVADDIHELIALLSRII